MRRRRTITLLAAGTMLLVLALPAQGKRASTRHAAIPVLMYHVITGPPKGAPYPSLYVTKAEFAAQMQALATRGYRAVTLSQAYDHWRNGTPLPRRPIILTFDDGYRSVYENAFPILRARKWPAVVNLEVRFLDRPWGLSRRRIRRLLSANWELASHTINHPDLTSLAPTELRRQVATSRAMLRREFRVPVSFFCYPSGRYDARVIAAVQAARYLGATSTRYGLARPEELWTLARVRVDRGDGAAGLRAKLAALGG